MSRVTKEEMVQNRQEFAYGPVFEDDEDEAATRDYFNEYEDYLNNPEEWLN